jgi:ketosteroid isomerase-like protein
MTSRSQIESIVKSLCEARLRGDLDGVLKDIAADARFSLNGRGTGVQALGAPCQGMAAIKPVIQQLIDTWRFDRLEQVELMVEGEKAVVHWRADVTCIPTGKSAPFEIVDLITFRDGRIVDYQQSTDTALIMKLAS